MPVSPTWPPDDALARTGGAVSQAADLLQVGKATLYDKIKRYGL